MQGEIFAAGLWSEGLAFGLMGLVVWRWADSTPARALATFCGLGFALTAYLRYSNPYSSAIMTEIIRVSAWQYYGAVGLCLALQLLGVVGRRPSSAGEAQGPRKEVQQ